MSGQKEIAKTLGITQATVSMALRGHRRISPETRRQVCDAAERMGYHLNEHVTVLMSNMRTGKKLTHKGTIGLLVDFASQEEWLRGGNFRSFHRGVLQRAAELGLRIETFFLKEPHMGAARLDQILYNRGIKGIILAPPGHGEHLPDLHRERYTIVGAHSFWEGESLNRVGSDQFQNYLIAARELTQLGYQRIGTALNKKFVEGSRMGTKWYTGYLEHQNSIAPENRIPVFAHEEPLPDEKISTKAGRILCAAFKDWFIKWKPDVILALNGNEKSWRDSMKLKIPDDVGVADLARSATSSYAGIDEKNEVLGSTALDLVCAQISRNEFGRPVHSTTTTIKGCWVNGNTLKTPGQPRTKLRIKSASF